MRPELELIEKIEQYLKGELTAADRIAFEKQIANDPALREEMRLQQELMKGIERSVLKQKIQAAGRSFHFQKNFMKWGLGGLGAIVILVAAFFIYKNLANTHAYEGNSLPELNELGESLWADADRNIAVQTFIIDASKDTVIETKGGIVMAIPAHAFIDEKGNAAEGKMDLYVKEALDKRTILNAGLSTRSGNELLETGGMFFTDARKDGKILKIDPARSIYAEIPADSVKPGMQLFNGVRKTDGSIDWVNPKPLEKDLVPVDIHSLNFYPPLYLDSLQRWGYDISNKKFTDSLYYSLARLFQDWTIDEKNVSSENMYIGPESVAIPKEGNFKPDTTNKPTNKDYASDSIAPDVRTDRAQYFGHMSCGINPAKIKAIWNEKFNNTILATREFEERLKWIHTIGASELLDLYLSNLDKSLYYSDSIIAAKWNYQYKDQLISFAARHDGKIKNASPQVTALKKYYENKTKAFTEAIAKTQNEFWNKQAQLNNQASDKRLEYGIDSVNRIAQNFREEYKLNLVEAYRQLGYDTAIKPIPPNAYAVQITTTGWNNVDKYVYESTLTRNTLDYTDPDGKKAVIRYAPFSIQITNWNEYDRLYVYLLPNKLSSFMRLTGTEGKYSEKLDELMQHELVCIGYKKEQAFFFSTTIERSPYYATSLHYNTPLTPISEAELNQKLNTTGKSTQSSAIFKEQAFLQFEIIDQKRQKQNFALAELTYKVIRVVFPCAKEFYAYPEFSKLRLAK